MDGWKRQLTRGSSLVALLGLVFVVGGVTLWVVELAPSAASLHRALDELGEQGPDSDGDGIGLYLVSRLADIYGGAIELEESPGGGALFRVTLPTTGS